MAYQNCTKLLVNTPLSTGFTYFLTNNFTFNYWQLDFSN